jgi:tetratricopeptide (TPR) repeat protein
VRAPRGSSKLDDFLSMARRAAIGIFAQVRSVVRTVRGCLAAPARIAAALLILSARPLAPAAGQSDPVKAEASLAASNGYARLVLKFASDVGSEVSTAGSIIIIRFEHPVDVNVDRLSEAVPDYISSARSDPDGTAIRLSLAQRARINTMTAGERLFVDFLPDNWTGAPPPLPMEVVRELAERARAAERALRQQRAEAIAKKRPAIRVRALVQPTFVRFIFEMPDGVGASSVLNDQKLTLQFSTLLTFDLADAKIAAPPNIASIDQKIEGDKTWVEIGLIGDVDVHSFREDKNYTIDVAFQQPDRAKSAAAEVAKVSRDAGAPSAAPSAEKPAARPSDTSARQPDEITPPTSETIARQMKMDKKAEAEASKAAPPSEQGQQHVSAEPAPPAPEAPPKEMPQAAAEAAKADPKVDTPRIDAPKVEIPKLETAKIEAPNVEAPKIEGPKDAPKAEALKAEAPKAEAPMAEAPKKMTAAPPAADVKGPAEAASVDAWRDSDGLRLTFSFPSATPAASFRRGDTVWLVFDSERPLDVDPIRAKGGAIIGDVSRLPIDKGQAIRIRLNRPLMHSLVTDEHASGASWILTFADKVQTPPQPLMVLRNITDPALANIVVPFTHPGLLHRIVDPDAGDTLMVVTGAPPIRGFIKRQDFVDFSLLDTAQGIAIRPNSDNIAIEVSPDKIIVGKPGGLTISSVDITSERAPIAVRPIFDTDEWNKNQKEPFLAREYELIRTAALAEPDQRGEARLALAKFYMARGFYAEARGQTEFLLSEPNPKFEQFPALMVHAIASILTNRPQVAIKDLDNPAIGNNYDSQLWKALAYAWQRKWADAREKFKNVEFAIAALPIDMQRLVTIEAMRASLEVKDFAGAAKRRAELDVIGVSDALKPQVAVLSGRLAEGLGHEKDALDEYKFAVASSDRHAAARAKLLEVALKQKRNEISQEDALRELETLAVIWRGDATEVQTLQMLAQIYNETGHYAESLQAARTATKLEPNSEVSRQAQDQASTLFSDIFLSAKGDNLPPIDALGMFYEFRELTPIGRRGDEMIRRLADRLTAIDLLDQAAELLRYQVDHRLEGAARAQVAAKLAMVYLMNRKPDLAIEALRSTRIADLSGELRQQRLLLESRAQSDVGRYDLALDIVSNISGREAVRLRSDIYWAARRWRESSEQIELYYGDRWRDFKPLNPVEKSDVIRAVVGYALAEDAIGLARFREKYAPLMSGEADRIAFDIASKPAATSSGDFAAIAKMAAGVDTLDGFIREMKARFPDGSARPQADNNPTGSLPQIVGIRRVGG